MGTYNSEFDAPVFMLSEFDLPKPAIMKVSGFVDREFEWRVSP
jgi:hypothetical protein